MHNYNQDTLSTCYCMYITFLRSLAKFNEKTNCNEAILMTYRSWLDVSRPVEYCRDSKGEGRREGDRERESERESVCVTCMYVCVAPLPSHLIPPSHVSPFCPLSKPFEPPSSFWSIQAPLSLQTKKKMQIHRLATQELPAGIPHHPQASYVWQS